MKSKDFLISNLKEIGLKYPLSTIAYYFDSFDNDHYVCISPSEELNKVIDNEALTIDRNFLKFFPTESLSFISFDDSLSFDKLLFSHKPQENVLLKNIQVLKITVGNEDTYKFKTTEEFLYPPLVFESKVEILENEEYAFAA
jgi:hypothetical protein